MTRWDRRELGERDDEDEADVLDEPTERDVAIARIAALRRLLEAEREHAL